MGQERDRKRQGWVKCLPTCYIWLSEAAGRMSVLVQVELYLDLFGEEPWTKCQNASCYVMQILDKGVMTLLLRVQRHSNINFLLTPKDVGDL